LQLFAENIFLKFVGNRRRQEEEQLQLQQEQEEAELARRAEIDAAAAAQFQQYLQQQPRYHLLHHQPPQPSPVQLMPVTPYQFPSQQQQLQPYYPPPAPAPVPQQQLQQAPPGGEWPDERRGRNEQDRRRDVLQDTLMRAVNEGFERAENSQRMYDNIVSQVSDAKC
jgi:hypothetical protein